MTLSSSRLTTLLGLALFAAAQAACGGSASDTTSPPPGTSAAGKSGAAGSGAGKGGASGSSGAASGAGGSSAGASGEGGAAGKGGGGSSGKGGAAGSATGGNGGASGSAGSGTAGSNAGGSSGSNTGGSAGNGAGGSAGNGAGGSIAGSGGSNAGGSNAGGSNAGGSNAGGSNAGGSNAGGSNAGGSNAGGSSGSGGAVFDVEPTPLQTIAVQIGQQTPTVTYSATLGGNPVSAGWSVDKGNIGTIAPGPSPTGVFTPTGTTGGLVDVIAGLNGQTLKRQVFVQLTGIQNGPNGSPAEMAQIPTGPGDLTAGGGIGGVGGEGLGTMVPNATINLLTFPSGDGSAQGLRFLYPYDHTVWPRGLLAPLLMWDWSVGDADAILISLKTTTGSFAWTGTFGKPPILMQTGGKFVRHPIPQDVWKMATDTAGGADQLTVSLTVASGGQAFGPISETWTIAPARLAGTIYYNSYGTQLAQNYSGAVGGNGMFGGAVLSIHVGDTGPKLAAGASGGVNQCRVCHSVASSGSRLVVQHGENYGVTSAYDLTPNGNVEHVLSMGSAFPAVYPDGSMMLSASGQLVSLPNSQSIPVSGLGGVSSNLGTPAFSPDGKHIVFNPMNDAGALGGNPTQKLVTMDFDPTSGAFSNPVVVADATGSPPETRPGWPVFLPDLSAIVFELQSAAGFDGNGSGALFTRKGARGQLAWVPANGGPITTLDRLNGKGYLPKLASPINMSCTADGSQVGNIDPDHGDDVDLNYEPTVNPIVSGGYAWVVFTSRRLYGNEAVIPPFCSDPRGVDLIQNLTTKKLWVAAIDLGAPAGTDASHPAFYLPAQEILAGNARGFWVLDPCRADGSACDEGDECCNGYCEPNGQGQLVCSNTPPNSMCSQITEKCASAADCCDPTLACINGFCVQSKP